MEERSDNGYSHILKYTSLFGGVQGLTILISLVRNKAMAVFLGAAGVGLNSLLTSMQNFIQVTILRDGKEQVINVTLEAYQE